MLKNLRISFAAIFFAGLTLLFLGIGRDWWGWMAKLQLLPACIRLASGALAGNIAIVAGILALTLVFGRIYCSVICPMGVYQDAVLWVRKTLSRSFPKNRSLQKRFSFSKERRWLRLSVAALCIISAFVCGQLLISILAPYSAYGRMVRAVSTLAAGNASTALLGSAAVTFVTITLCAWVWGRAWCNTICPVGTLLGLISQAAFLRLNINEDKCISCGQCARNCKASCIDMKNHKVDGSRCVNCFDCIGNCREGAITYSFHHKKAE